LPVAQVGVEPTASLVLSQGGLPVAYRATCLLCPKQESNLQSLGFKPSRSASWRIRARVVPDGLEPPLPGCRPGVVAAGPRDCLNPSGSRETRTRNGVTRTCFRDRFLIRPDDFRLPSSGGWNRTNALLVQSQASLPAATAPDHVCISDTHHSSRFTVKFGEQDLNLHHRVQSPAACR
jgi:hypothetical protein